MATEQVITLATEPTDRDIVKSHPLFSFINIGQRGRKCVFSILIIIQKLFLAENG